MPTIHLHLSHTKERFCTTFICLLQNRFYIGETSYQGKKKGAEKKYIQGTHEPIISVELFNKRQEVRDKRANKGAKAAPNQIVDYPLASLLYCPQCGSKWRGWHLRGDRRYRDPAKDRGRDCPSEMKSIPAEIIEEQAADILLNLNLPEDWRERAIALLTKDRPRLPSTKIHQANLETKLERLKQLFVMGDISEAEYKRMRDEIRSQSQSLAFPMSVHSNILDMERVAAVLGDIKHLWATATLKEREVWFKMMYEEIYVHEGAIKAIKPTATLWALLSYSINYDTLYGADGI